jgi:hypothetical protein
LSLVQNKELIYPRKMKHIMTVLLLISSLAFADNKSDQLKLDEAKVLLSSKDSGENKKGFLMLKSLADAGVPEAALGLGLMYYKGTGVSKDSKLAYQWYEKAAEGGNSRALYLLAVRYRSGCGGEKKDLAKSEELLKKALALANEKEKKDIENLEKQQADKNVCSDGFVMRPYENYKFSGWDLENRKKCPQEHTNKKSKFMTYIDPTKYDVEKWCQCYLANIKQETMDDIKTLDQKIDFYTEGCLKESLLK